MPQSAEIRRFTRRVRVGLFAGATADAIATLTLFAAAALLVGRLMGAWPAPQPWWTAALLLPLLWGALSVRRSAFDDARSVVHLDRRLGLDGLLITGLEQDTGAWSATLSQRMARAREALPVLRTRRLLARAAVPLAVLGAVLLLPPPEPPLPPADPAVALAIEDLEEQIDLLIEETVVDEEKGEELKARLQELADNAAGGEPVEWADVDAMRDELQHERAQLGSAMEKTRAALAELSAQAASATPASAAEQLSDTLEQAAKAGLLDGLDPALLEQLGMTPGEGAAVDPSQLPASMEDLLALSEALLEAMDGRLEGLEGAGLLDLGELADLGELVDAELLPLDPNHVHGGT